VTGTVKGITVDFRPPTPRRAVLEARKQEGHRVLEHIGLTISPDSPAAGGLLVSSRSAPSSPADKRGVLVGDLITTFQGIKVMSVGDMAPRERLPRQRRDRRAAGRRSCPPSRST
jgi:NADH-quinone oxidoreductase subunit H